MLDHLFPARRQHPDRPAVTFAGRTRTFAELDADAARLSARLAAAGVTAGDRVAGWLDSSPDLLVAVLATWRLGAAWVPLNTRYRTAEVEHVLGDATPRVVLVDADPERREVLARLDAPTTLAPEGSGPPPAGAAGAGAVQDSCDPAPDEAALPADALALVMYTSGTTGRAKGVEHTAGSLAAGIGALADLWRLGPADRLSLQLPLFHVHGLCIGVVGSLLRGVHLLLHPRFAPGTLLEDARVHGATVFMGVPTMYWRLLQHLDAHPESAEVLRGMRLFTSGSAPLPAAQHVAFEAHTGHRILERYGMTETLLTLSNPLEGERRPGFVGYPVGTTEIRIFAEAEAGENPEAREGVERGELGVRGPSLMRGYRGLTEATARSWRDGYFLTGDEVERGPDGMVRILGRRSTDLIKSGGFRIAAGEIEAALLEHPEVSEAAVFGVKDEEWGERIVAAVVPEGALDAARRAMLADALPGWVGERLAGFKRPREVRVLDGLPRNALGKVQKVVLRRGWGSAG